MHNSIITSLLVYLHIQKTTCRHTTEHDYVFVNVKYEKSM